MKIAFAGFGEVNTPVEIIERKCLSALNDLKKSGAEVYSCYPITDDYEEKDVNKAIDYFKGKDFDKLYVNSDGYTNVIVKNINSNKAYSDKHRALMSESFCSEIIREFTLPTDTVLDPFMGLATTGIYCHKHKRKFVGIEIYKPYFDMARERMADETAQITIDDWFNNNDLNPLG